MQLLFLLLWRVTLQAHQIQLPLRTCRLWHSLHPLSPLLNRLWRPNNLPKAFKCLRVLQAWLEQLEAFPRRLRRVNKACKVKLPFLLLLVWAFCQFFHRPNQLLSPKVGQTLLFLLLCRPFPRRVSSVAPSPSSVATGLFSGMPSPLPLSNMPALQQSFVLPPGYSPVPPKLVTQIVANKLVNFSDLLSINIDQSQSDSEPQLLFDGRLVLTSTPKKPKKRIEDISGWMETFSAYCCVLTAHLPNRAKDLLLYQMLILQTYHQFSGRVWLAYDRAFHEHAAATNVTDCSAVNVQLFNFHAAGAAVRSDVATVSSEPHGAASSNTICRSWNSGRCVAPSALCRFAHKCSTCYGQHRVGDCSANSSKQSANALLPLLHVPAANPGDPELCLNLLLLCLTLRAEECVLLLY